MGNALEIISPPQLSTFFGRKLTSLRATWEHSKNTKSPLYPDVCSRPGEQVNNSVLHSDKDSLLDTPPAGKWRNFSSDFSGNADGKVG